jgi:TPR repeat protein
VRSPTLITLLLFMPLGAWGGVHWHRGIPALQKPGQGLLVKGEQGPPDLARGNQARLAGHFEEAQRDLLPLAQRGYVDAQLYLAAVYAQLESPAAQQSAIDWYRRVLPRRPDAAMPLARAFIRRGDRASLQEAERLLVAVQYLPEVPGGRAALLDLYGQYPQLDVAGTAPAAAALAARSTLPDLRNAAISWYRAAIADPAHARRLLELCRANLRIAPACYVDLATYYRYSGNHAALDQLVTEAIESLHYASPAANFDDLAFDPIALPSIAGQLAVALVSQPVDMDPTVDGEALPAAAAAEVALRAEASDDSSDLLGAPDVLPQYAAPPESPGDATPTAPAVIPVEAELANRLLRYMLSEPGLMRVEAAGVAVNFPYLLPDVDLEAVLTTGLPHRGARAALLLGELYYFNQRVPRAPMQGEASLQVAVGFLETSAPGHYRLGRLYQQGYLGRPDPQLALDHLLYAARHHVIEADTHLARLFYDSPGARIDRINAYVFARLSEDGGMPVVVHSLRGGVLAGYRLLDHLQTELTEAERTRAQALYQREREAYPLMRPQVSPLVWVRNAGH